MLQKERNEKQEMATNIRVELRHNQEFVALEEEKRTGKTPGQRGKCPCGRSRIEEKRGTGCKKIAKTC